MVTVLYLLVVAVFGFWIGVALLRRRGLLPSYIGTQGPILTLHTKRFRALVEAISTPRRAWRAWGNFGVGVATVVMVGSFVFLVFVALSTLRDPGRPSAVNQPRNFLVIPGLNEFLPLSVAPEIVLALVIALVVHEGGHAIMCRVGEIDIASMGLALLTIVPIGAFVEPDEESRKRADRGDQTRMFAAGVMNNFAVTIVVYALLFWPVVGSIGVADGAFVGGSFQGSPAAAAGIDKGDRILAVSGRPVANNSALESRLRTVADRTVTVRVDEGRTTRTATVERSLLVTGITEGTPFADTIRPNTTIVAVNGTPVYTETGFTAALEAHEVATLTVVLRRAGTEERVNVTGPVGASVRFLPDGPAAAAGLPAGGTAVITAIDDRRVVSATDLTRTLDGTEPGETVSVRYYVDGTRGVTRVELGEDPRDGSGFLGVEGILGTSGVTVNDFGVRLYPADRYLALMDGGRGGSFFGRIIVALQLPLASLTGGEFLPFNFAGFTGGVQNFYEPTGALGALGGAVFVIANLLFWTGWINLNLAIFNCIPAFPLDGGHILRASTEAVVSRLPVDRRDDLTTMVTTTVGLAMLVSLVLMIAGPQLLAM